MAFPTISAYEELLQFNIKQSLHSKSSLPVETHAQETKNVSLTAEQNGSPINNRLEGADGLISKISRLQASDNSKEQLDDEELESHAEKINSEFINFSTAFRKEVMVQLHNVKCSISKKYQGKLQKLEQERETAMAEYKFKSERMQESINRRDHYLSRFKTIMLRMANSIAKLKREQKKKHLEHIIFSTWKAYAKRRSSNSQQVKIILQMKQNQSLRKVFYEWKQWVRQNRAHQTNLLWETKLQSTSNQIKSQYELRIEQLERHVQELQVSLAQEAKEKVALQENLKTALMRGVCALNNKFLEIIKESSVQETDSLPETREAQSSIPSEPQPQLPTTNQPQPYLPQQWMQETPLQRYMQTGNTTSESIHTKQAKRPQSAQVQVTRAIHQHESQERARSNSKNFSIIARKK